MSRYCNDPVTGPRSWWYHAERLLPLTSAHPGLPWSATTIAATATASVSTGADVDHGQAAPPGRTWWSCGEVICDLRGLQRAS